MNKEETLLTKITPASLIKSMQFFIGLGMGIITLWYSSTQWQKNATEMLFEIKELRKEQGKMERNLSYLTRITKEHGQHKIKVNLKLSVLESQIKNLQNSYNNTNERITKNYGSVMYSIKNLQSSLQEIDKVVLKNKILQDIRNGKK